VLCGAESVGLFPVGNFLRFHDGLNFMSNVNYRAGANFEYKRKKYYESDGLHVIRSAGSHGKFDLTCLYDHMTPTLVQCKRVKTLSAAHRLLDAFVKSPPLAASDKYCQIMDVYVEEARAVFSETV